MSRPGGKPYGDGPQVEALLLVASDGAPWSCQLRLARWGARKYRPVAGEIVPVDFLISSGSLISLAALADIGPFDESLFTEHVGTELN